MERSWGSAGRGYREIRELREAQGKAKDSGKYKKTHKAFCLQFTWLESQVDVAHTKGEGVELEREKTNLLGTWIYFSSLIFHHKMSFRRQGCRQKSQLPLLETFFRWLWLAVAHQAYDGYLRSSAEHSLHSSYSSDIICIVKLSVWPEA